MSEPKRIQRQRTKGWRMPENTVYVGRPSRWGNPYVVSDWEGPLNAWSAVDIFRRDLELALTKRPEMKADLDLLRGKNLACWCPLGQPCHADVLLKMANS